MWNQAFSHPKNAISTGSKHCFHLPKSSLPHSHTIVSISTKYRLPVPAICWFYICAAHARDWQQQIRTSARLSHHCRPESDAPTDFCRHFEPSKRSRTHAHNQWGSNEFKPGTFRARSGGRLSSIAWKSSNRIIPRLFESLQQYFVAFSVYSRFSNQS